MTRLLQRIIEILKEALEHLLPIASRVNVEAIGESVLYSLESGDTQTSTTISSRRSYVKKNSDSFLSHIRRMPLISQEKII